MLRYSLLTAGLLLGASAFAAPAGDLPLMPWPAKVERPTTQGALVLNNQLSVSVSGDDLGDAVNRLRQRIALQTGWTLQPQADKPEKPTIRIAIAKKVKPQPLPDSDESYKLTVDANGVDISANTRFGALRAIETLLQLVQNGAENTSVPWVTIEDFPALPVARAAAGLGAPLYPAGGYQTPDRRYGRGKTQRAALAFNRRSGLAFQLKALS